MFSKNCILKYLRNGENDMCIRNISSTIKYDKHYTCMKIDKEAHIWFYGAVKQ